MSGRQFGVLTLAVMSNSPLVMTGPQVGPRAYAKLKARSLDEAPSKVTRGAEMAGILREYG